jgi:hypothetical protein
MATNDQHVGEEYAEERSPWSKPSVMLSAMFLFALLLAGIAVMIFGGGNATHHSPPATHASTGPSSAGSPAQTSRPAAAGGCSLPASSQTVPYNSPPAGTTWNQVGSMETPQAPSTLGPQQSRGVWNTCFAHNPSGALLATFNLWAEGTAAAPSDVARHLAVGAPASLGNNERLDASGPVQFAGYKYGSYTPSTAQIFVVIRGWRGGLEAVGATMRWTGSDWRYVFPSQGVPPLQQLSDLTGYVTWSQF